MLLTFYSFAIHLLSVQRLSEHCEGDATLTMLGMERRTALRNDTETQVVWSGTILHFGSLFKFVISSSLVIFFSTDASQKAFSRSSSHLVNKFPNISVTIFYQIWTYNFGIKVVMTQTQCFC